MMKRLFSKSFIFLTIAILVLSVPATLSAAQPNINAWGDFATGKVKRGGSVQGRVYMDIPGGFHTQSNRPSDKYLVATKLEVYPPSGVRIGTVSYPAAKFITFGPEKKKLSVFEGRVTMRFNVTVPANYGGGEVEIKCKLRFQSCNDRECYPPTSKDVWMKISVG
jgi:DsbC/DsbD-like thiol-disulfide interchange protein